MRISDLINMGLRNLSRRKARTALTVIGVVIGTISIVVMISIGIGMNTSFREQVMELGSLTVITINKRGMVVDENGNYLESKEQLMDDNLVGKLRQIEHVKVATPVIYKSIKFYAGKSESYTQMYAMDSETFQEFGFPALTSGEYPSPENPDIILVGADMPNSFYTFTGRNSKQMNVDFNKDRIQFTFNTWEYQLPQDKKEKRVSWKNFAIMEKSNGEYDWGTYMDIDVFRGYYREYAKQLKPEDRKRAEKSLYSYEQIKVNVDSIKNVEKVQKAITELGYVSESLGMYLKPMEQTSNMMQMVLGGVGAVAMLVSAISIANTMVMSIYERTKEIGVMKVLGCVVKDVKKLFLFEAGMIGLLGGIIGIVLSYVASYCINTFGAPVFSALMNSGGMYGQETASKFSIIPIWLPVLAAAFAMGVGILSGYYPANRATKISAIEAMKSEG